MKLQTKDRTAFYTVESLGKSREITPEGFLLCKGVAIARTGQQLYTSEEIPLEDTGNGEIRIDRVPEEVFRAETIASFEGKPVTVEHPDEFVTPENWNRLAVGTVQNVRRGEGLEDDLLVADLLITAADAIAYVNEKLPELSAGYEADYEQTEPGRGMQRNIVGNHVALVERGRAGPRCSIQDGVPHMAKKQSFLDRLRALLKDAEAEAKEEKEESKDEAPEDKKDEETKDDAGLEARIARLEAMIEKLAGKTGDSDEEETKDSDEDDEKKEETADTVIEPETTEKADVGTTYTGDAFKAVVARAEILSPGIAVPTGDAIKAKDAATKLMRKALDNAMASEDGKACVTPFLMGRELKALTGDALSGVFHGAAELMRIRNNDKGARIAITTQDFGKAISVADINARNREFWAKQAR